jgi:putative NADH-flavin reductase
MTVVPVLKMICTRLALCLVILLAGCVSPQVKLDVEDIARGSQPPDRDITIALIGATGMAGRYILQRALAEGYPVKVLARTPAKLEDLAPRIDIVQGDARDPDAIVRLLSGSDVVITALGPVKADGAAAQMISTTATGHVISALEDSDVTRYIVVSGAAVVVPGDERNLTGWWMRQLVKLRLGSVLADKQAEYQLLETSDVDWTLVRCPLIDSEPYENAPRVSLLTPSSFHLRAGELADFIIRELDAPAYLRQAPFLYSE